MRVALVIEWLDAWRGGAETSTAQFVRHLLARDVDLTVFTRSRDIGLPQVTLRTIAVGTPSRAYQARSFARRSAQAVRAERFDIVHAISPCLAANVYEPRGGTVAETVLRNLAMRPPGLGRAFKRVVNRLNLKQRFLLKLEKTLLSGPRRPIVIALSDYVARQLGEHYDYPAERIRKVFNGVEPDQADAATRQRDRTAMRQRYAIRDDDYLAILVAHNFKLKGLHRWLEACRLLVEETGLSLRSLVVGRDRTTRWERMVVRAGLSDCVQFTGPTRYPESFFHAADVLVHPTYYDPCSRVVLEAMAAGLPVVTTRHDGAAEVIEDGVNGFVVDDAGCIQALADRVERLADRDVRAKMGVRAAGVADGVSMARHAAGVHRVYQEIVEAGQACWRRS